MCHSGNGKVLFSVVREMKAGGQTCKHWSGVEAAAHGRCWPVQNPDTPNPGPNAGLGDKADFPKEKMEQFGGNFICPLESCISPRHLHLRQCTVLASVRCAFVLATAAVNP